MTEAEAFRSVMTAWKWVSTSAGEQEEGTQTANVKSGGSEYCHQHSTLVYNFYFSSMTFLMNSCGVVLVVSKKKLV